MTRRLGIATVLSALFLVVSVSSSSAAGPVWRIEGYGPTTAAAGQNTPITAQVVNIGDEANSGTFTVEVDLPSDVTAVSATIGYSPCTVSSNSIQCESSELASPRLLTYQLVLNAALHIDDGASGIYLAQLHVSGGGGGEDSTVVPIEVAPSPPGFGISAFDVGTAFEPGGGSDSQAADHPYSYTTTFEFNSVADPRPAVGSPTPSEPVKDIVSELPPGFIGVPRGVVKCSAEQLANSDNAESKPFCPPESQVGTALIRTDSIALPGFQGPLPIYNLVAPPDTPARFGFNILGSVVTLNAAVRSDGDYGLTVTSANVPEAVQTVGGTITFWGVPADPSHDGERGCPGEYSPYLSNPGPTCTSDAEPAAFFRNPTSCTASPDEGLPTTLRIDSWEHPGVWQERTTYTHEGLGYPYPESFWGPQVGITGCEEVPFEPLFEARGTSSEADSPTGLDFDLYMPQEALTRPNAIAQSDLRTAETILPQGMTVNPAAAGGLTGCSLADVGLDNTEDPKCPDSSIIGTVEIDSPQLDDLLVGKIYQAKQFDNPNGSLLGFYTVAKGSGVLIKLFAHVERDPETGQLRTIFDDNPQLPFNRYSLHFKEGPRAPVINPPSCGTATTQAVFTPYARPGEEVHRKSEYEITSGPGGGPCPTGGFDPGFKAGTVNPIGGAYTPLVMRLTRDDGTQRLTGVSATFPEGLLGKLAGIPYCPEAALAGVSTAAGTGVAELATPACPAASQVGKVTVGSGAGPAPFFLETGRAYLAGPYKGAPLSLAIVTPAVAGPLDLGSVVVRTALRVDPETLRITAASDPLPLFVHGIALDLRDVRILLDRPQFILNPTSCDPMAIEADVSGSGGASAHRSERFQVANCSRLRFKPKLSLRLKGGTHRSDFPALRAELKMPPGANIDRASVAFPRSEFLGQAHIRTICTRVQFAADQCPRGSVYGYARAFSPLLEKPLEGPVYLRSSNHTLPDLVAALRGQIAVDLVGRIDSVHGGIRNTFDFVPDAPVTKFVLTMQGGKKGLLENSRDICRYPGRATARFEGQNGKTRDFRPLVKPQCGKKGKRAGKNG